MRALTDLARGCSEGAPSPQLEALILAGLTDAICTCTPRMDNLVPSTFAEKREVRSLTSYLISPLCAKIISQRGYSSYSAAIVLLTDIVIATNGTTRSLVLTSLRLHWKTLSKHVGLPLIAFYINTPSLLTCGTVHSSGTTRNYPLKPNPSSFQNGWS